jgi:hypothetical protein
MRHIVFYDLDLHQAYQYILDPIRTFMAMDRDYWIRTLGLKKKFAEHSFPASSVRVLGSFGSETDHLSGTCHVIPGTSEYRATEAQTGTSKTLPEDTS